ncbi:putative uncharacterized protein [Firmicutes bacterium CAG:95]|nr:putative uncharacterized protein [Firmicutes bacterium CAG:95]
MFGNFNIGIMGSGNIAGIMAGTINKMKNVRVYAVASRQQVHADVFAGKYGCKKAYGSYADLAADKKVDLIYVATPHSEHYENVKMCLEAGKPVLCEKAFTLNATQAEELVRIAAEHKVFLAEAMWTRYMPMLTTIREVIGSGIIGEPKTLTANLGYVIGSKERLTNLALGGGALLDVGVYTINFALMIFGHNISKIASCCTFTETGVDEQNAICLQYYDGKVANLNSSMVSLSDRQGIIYGTKGFAVVENINNFESIAVYDKQYKKVASYKCPKQISGYEYEVAACIDAIKCGQIECAQMPHSETLRVMRIMDEIRSQWGMKYPCEAQEEEGKHLVELADQPQTAETAEATVTADVAEAIEATEATEAAGAIDATVTAEALETAKITVTAGSAEAAEVTGTAENTEVSKTAEDIA